MKWTNRLVGEGVMKHYKSTHGGKRIGAGRKPSGIVDYHVRITKHQAALLKTWGGGDLSAGLRWLVDAAVVIVRKAQRTPPTRPPSPATPSP